MTTYNTGQKNKISTVPSSCEAVFVFCLVALLKIIWKFLSSSSFFVCFCFCFFAKLFCPWLGAMVLTFGSIIFVCCLWALQAGPAGWPHPPFLIKVSRGNYRDEAKTGNKTKQKYWSEIFFFFFLTCSVTLFALLRWLRSPLPEGDLNISCWRLLLRVCVSYKLALHIRSAYTACFVY